MCDHCSKVTSLKGYAGQVTCRCEQNEKKEQIAREIPKKMVKEKSKDMDKESSSCSKKSRELADSCCKSGCCGNTRGRSPRDELRTKKYPKT